MNLNQVTANLNFITSVVHTLNTDCKMFKISDANKKEFSMDIKYSKPATMDAEKIGKLLMTINVSVFQEETELPPDTFEIVIEGIFSSSADISEEEFMGLLNVNGGAALYSIARSKLEAISSLVYAEGKILLPMVNIIQYYQDRNNSSEE